MKYVEGVYGNEIARDYRRTKLPSKVLRELAFWFLTALLGATFMVAGAVVALSMLG